MKASESNRSTRILMAIILAGVAVVISLVFFLFTPWDREQQDFKSAIGHEGHDQSIQDQSVASDNEAESGREEIDYQEEIEAIDPGPGATADSGCLLVLDDQTGTPLGGLEYIIVAVDASVQQCLVRGKTSAEGEAHLPPLKKGYYIVRTERRPPNCFGFRTFQIPPEDDQVSVLRVGRGGILKGQVVDDLDQPLKGFRICTTVKPILYTLFAGSDQEPQPIAETDEKGCFEAECLVTVPLSIRMKDGIEMTVSSRNPRIMIKDPEREGRRQLSISESLAEGEVKDLGKIVFKNNRRYMGRVLDGKGDPVIDAYVTTARLIVWTGHFNAGDLKQVSPWSDRFELHKDDCFTSALGAFAVTKPDSTGQVGDGLRDVLVWTRRGMRQAFKLPEIDLGETATDIILQLKDHALLELEFRNSKGERTISWNNKGRPPRFINLSGLQWRFIGRNHIRAYVSLKNNKDCILLRPHIESTGLVHLQVENPVHELSSLEILVPGFLPVHDLLPPGLVNGARRVYTLEEVHKILVGVNWTEGGEYLTPAHGKLTLHACLLSPEARDKEWVSNLKPCCGLGGEAAAIPLNPEFRNTILPVLTDEPYWIYPSLYSKVVKVTPAVLGPFSPSSKIHVLDLALKPLGPEDKPSFSRKDLSSCGTVSFTVSDSHNAQPIHRAWVSIKKDSNSKIDYAAGDSRESTTKEGLFSCDKIPQGDWFFEIAKKGYRENIFGPLAVASGKKIDLGVILLEPSPVIHGRLLNPDGTPATTGTKLFYSPLYRETVTAEDGLFELYSDKLPSPCWLGIQTPEHDIQAVYLDMPDTATQTVELRMEPWQQVEIHVYGIPAQHKFCLLELYLHHESDPVNDWNYIREIRSPSTKVRIFRFKTGSGRYLIKSYGLYRFPDTVIDVNSPEPVQVVDLNVN